MTPSLRFGPPPADLIIARKLPKYPSNGASVFIPVRARIGGGWHLGVLREWMSSGRGRVIRIEIPDATSPIGVMSEWYEYDPEAINVLGIHTGTGEIWLMPPKTKPTGPSR